MATLIPATGTSAFDSTGDRRLAELLTSFAKHTNFISILRAANSTQARQDFATCQLTNPLRRKLPHHLREKSGKYQSDPDVIQLVTIGVSSGLVLLLGAVTGMGHMRARKNNEKQTMPVFYMAATRTTQMLLTRVGDQCDSASRWHSIASILHPLQKIDGPSEPIPRPNSQVRIEIRQGGDIV